MPTIRQHLRYAEYITDFLDTKFNLLGIRIGVDPLLDFIPVFGPLLGGIMSLYILWIAWQLKVSSVVLVRMLLNISLDYVVGLIPFIGFLGDWFFKANVRNLKLLNAHMNADVLEGTVV